MRLDNDQSSYKHVKHDTSKVIMGVGETNKTSEIKVPAEYSGQVLKFFKELGARKKNRAEDMRRKK